VKPFYVYLLLCCDGTYYAGHTDDLDVRMSQHQAGDTGYTATRKPVQLVWQGEFESREGALAFERQIKGWSRAKKEALIAGDWKRVQALARSNIAQGLRQAQPERDGGQPERSGGQPERGVQHRESTTSVRPEPFDELRTGLVEGLGTGSVERLTQNLVSGTPMAQRRALAKAITLLESTRADHRAQADDLLTALLPHTGKGFRLGISGVPGVGKSTFIEALGLHLIGLGHRVAVLAVDPSSSISGGSILGDKTRMERLSNHERAYIRPSPSSGTLGGVAEKTRETILLCEAAGFDVVIVETVGVGQSEIAVADMTDLFCLLQLPNAGDELQAIKRGVMERADLVLINKADLDPAAATRARAQISAALRLLGWNERAAHEAPHWHPQVLELSALRAQGLEAFWAAVCEFRRLQSADGRLAARRQQQALAWMWERVQAGLQQALHHNPAVQHILESTTRAVADGSLAASVAARRLLAAHHSSTPN